MLHAGIALLATGSLTMLYCSASWAACSSPSCLLYTSYQYAIKMLNLRDDACCSVKNYNKELKGTLSICASTVPSQYILPKVCLLYTSRCV